MTTMPSHSLFSALATSVRSLGRGERISEGHGMSDKKLTGELSAHEDALTYRQFFAARWRDFIRENYQSPAHVAFVWRVDPTTARNWWDGMNAPQGWVVARAMTDPETAEQAARHLAAGKSETCGNSNAE